MSHHYVQQLIHVLWSTKNQEFKIPLTVRNRLYAYLSTVINSIDGKLYLAGGHHDHLHCLLSLPPTMSIATMMKIIKSSSSKWLKYQESMDRQFSWEDGYTAISVQDDRVKSVCSYINDEEKRHEKLCYSDELSKILKLQNIQYDEKYLMKSSRSKVLLHVVWSTKNRNSTIDVSIRSDLHRQIADSVLKRKCVAHAVGGIEDHVHLLIEISRTMTLSDLVYEIKGEALRWLSTQGRTFQDFEWQTGYGAFSISISALDAVKQYVMNQEEHHKKSIYINEWNEFIMKKGLIVEPSLS